MQGNSCKPEGLIAQANRFRLCSKVTTNDYEFISSASTSACQVHGNSSSQSSKSVKNAIITDGSREESDSAHLNKKFPEEVWLLILDHLKSPSDLENACNSSPFFRNLLYPQRVLFLFPKVWDMLCIKNKYDRYLLSCRFNGREEWEMHLDSRRKLSIIEEPISIYRVEQESEDNLHDGLYTYSPILKMRLVCQTWNKVIDNFYINHPRHFQMGDDPLRLVVRTNCWTDFGGILPQTGHRSVRKFVLHFQMTHDGIIRSPFLSRKAHIEWIAPSSEPNNQTYWNNLLQFVMKYGEHLFYLDLQMDFQPDSTTNGCLFRLQELLTPLRNLKVLKIFSEQILELQPNEPEDFVPELPTLEHLQFLSMNSIPSSLVTPLICSNDHVSALETNRFGCVSSRLDHILKSPLQNLKHLSISVESKWELTQLESLERGHWHLEKLNLGIEFCGEVEWSRVFTLLESKWAESLVDLQLKLPSPEQEWDYGMKIEFLKNCQLLRLNLPRLKRLRITLTQFCSLDFILPMKDTLEMLDVDVCFSYKCSKLAWTIENEQKIQFLGFAHRGLESNIWKILPNLQRLRIFEGVFFVESEWEYTRKEWDLKNKMASESK